MYIAIVNRRLMSVIEEISRMSKVGCSDRELMGYIYENYSETECEPNGNESKEPKKRDRYFCMGCKLRKIVDYQKSTLACMRCGSFEYYPVYVTSHNHTMNH